MNPVILCAYNLRLNIEWVLIYWSNVWKVDQTHSCSALSTPSHNFFQNQSEKPINTVFLRHGKEDNTKSSI